MLLVSGLTLLISGVSQNELYDWENWAGLIAKQTKDNEVVMKAFVEK